MSMTIKQLPETERPYEKLELYGESTLSNAELLAIIIKTGTKEETSVQLAQKILNLNDTKQEGLNFLKDIAIEELTQIKGIGKIKAIQLKAIGELATRMSKPMNYKRVVVREPKDVVDVIMQELRFQKREIAKIIILNEKNEILKIKDLSFGGTSYVNISIKEILVEPIKMKAPKIILIHNHPTGDSTPSDADVKFTYNLYDLGDMLGIQLLDHIVIGVDTYTSIFSQIVANMPDTNEKEIKAEVKKKG